MKNLQNAFLGFLVIGLVIIGAMLVPQSHNTLITVGPRQNGGVVKTTKVYRVTYTASLATWFDHQDTPAILLEHVDCTPEAIRNAYATVFSNVEIAELPL